MKAVTEDQIYEIIGDAGFRQLVAVFYASVKTDELLGPLYPIEDFDGAEQRLAAFLIQRFGGPASYSIARGHPRLRMRHGPFPVDQAARDRWVTLMNGAMEQANLSLPVKAVLGEYFQSTATAMINRD